MSFFRVFNFQVPYAMLSNHLLQKLQMLEENIFFVSRPDSVVSMSEISSYFIIIFCLWVLFSFLPIFTNKQLKKKSLFANIIYSTLHLGKFVRNQHRHHCGNHRQVRRHHHRKRNHHPQLCSRLTFFKFLYFLFISFWFCSTSVCLQIQNM